MENSNRIPIVMETMSPVHVGSGEEIQGNYEYVIFQNKGTAGVLKAEKILNLIGKDAINAWVAAVDKGENLLQALPPLQNAEPEEICSRQIGISGSYPDGINNVLKAHYFEGSGEVTVPGSSLKGSIRTAILNHLIKEQPGFVMDNTHLKSRNRYKDEQIQAYYLGGDKKYNRRENREEWKQNARKDLLKLLRVSDFSFPVRTELEKSMVLNLFRNGWSEKRELSSFLECIPANVISSGNIQIPKKMLEEVRKKNFMKSSLVDLLDHQNLFEIINNHTIRLLEAELKFWEEERDPAVLEEYPDRIQEILSIAQNSGPDACVLRVGAGSGWDFMTGAWPGGKSEKGEYFLSDDEWYDLKSKLRKKRYPDEMIYPKTRKMLEGGEPLGFVKLRVKE